MLALLFIAQKGWIAPNPVHTVSLTIGIYLSEALSTQGQREIPLLEALVQRFWKTPPADRACIQLGNPTRNTGRIHSRII